MKTSSRQEWFSLAGLFCAGALVAQTADSANPAAAAGAAAPARNQQPSAQEKEVDLQHLQRIYQAIVAYYKDHQDLPNWLSDLVPNYLPDANDLLSPVEKRTGKSVLYGRDDPKLHTSYIYEFNAGAAAEEFNRTRAVPLTCKEWKLMQIKKFGLVTPMLRCHLHNPVLNVSYNGQIFETGLLWKMILEPPRSSGRIPSWARNLAKLPGHA